MLVYAPVSEVEVTAADGNFKKEVRLAAVKREGKLTSRQNDAASRCHTFAATSHITK